MKLSTLNKYRSVWMGVAMLWVVFFHANLRIPNEHIAFIKKIGYGGVDLFLFASGLGTYFSYTKNHEPTTFMQRRLARLAPVYVPFIVIWLCYKFWLADGAYSIKAAIGNLFAVQGFTRLGNDFNWYIMGLLVVYILTPYFSGLIDRINKVQEFFLLIIILFIISIPFWTSIPPLLIASRIPIFVIGMYYAKLSKNNDKKLTGVAAAALMAAMLAGFILLKFFFVKYPDYLGARGLFWYPFILITPGLCILISILAELACKVKIIKAFFWILEKIGEYSFEVYLIHIFCFDVYTSYLVPEKILPLSNKIVLFIALLVIPLCLLLRLCSKVCCWFVRLFMNFRKKETVQKSDQT